MVMTKCDDEYCAECRSEEEMARLSADVRQRLRKHQPTQVAAPLPWGLVWEQKKKGGMLLRFGCQRREKQFVEMVVSSAKWIAAYASVHVGTKLALSRLRPDMSAKAVAGVCSASTSLLQGTVVGLMGDKLLARDCSMNRDVVFGYTKLVHKCVSASVGFFSYEIINMVLTRNTDVGMWVHHLIGFTGCLLLDGYRRFGYAPTSFLATELTVASQSIVTMLRLLKVRSKNAMTAALLLRAFLHVYYRIFMGPRVLHHMHSQISLGGLASARRRLLPTSILAYVIALSLLNVKWFGPVMKQLAVNLMVRYYTRS